MPSVEGIEVDDPGLFVVTVTGLGPTHFAEIVPPTNLTLLAYREAAGRYFPCELGDPFPLPLDGWFEWAGLRRLPFTVRWSREQRRGMFSLPPYPPCEPPGWYVILAVLRTTGARAVLAVTSDPGFDALCAVPQAHVWRTASDAVVAAEVPVQAIRAVLGDGEIWGSGLLPEDIHIAVSNAVRVCIAPSEDQCPAE
ncbi:MAG: hypothetical protein QME77_13525 [bacterium]|nr:hypothetical protein [bacterium]